MCRKYYVLLIVSVLNICFSPLFAHTQQASREAALSAQKKGNYKVAFEKFKELLQDSSSNYNEIGDDLEASVNCLTSLSRISEFDSFVESVIAAHPSDWRVKFAASRLYHQSVHHGALIAGKFERGYQRGGQVKMVSSTDRDRVRALQLATEAIKLSGESETKQEIYVERSQIYAHLAQLILANHAAWKLQHLTSITTLPDYDDYYYYYGGGSSPAPVNADGSPVLYSLPESFESAANDGERYRWALNMAGVINPAQSDTMRVNWAQFLESQFATRTAADYQFAPLDDVDKDNEGARFALHTLKDEETIARLANGVKRFSLPDEHNPIKIYKTLLNGSYKQQSLRALARLYEDRRQFATAAANWQKVYQLSKQQSDKDALDQIVGAWGQFEPIQVQEAGVKASIDYRFRNGSSVSLEAHRVDLPKLIEDSIAYLKNNQKEFDHSKIDLRNIAYTLVNQNRTQYIGERVASWKASLNPRENHFDRRTTLQTPVSEAGTYLLSATIAGGNTSKILLVLNDAVIVKKPLNQKALYFFADAKSGKPLTSLPVRFFGYSWDYSQARTGSARPYKIITSEANLTTDENGMIIASDSELKSSYQWLVFAKTSSGNTTHYGFSGIWYPHLYQPSYNLSKTYVVTDRPVYRPDQTVKFKAWIRQASYDLDLDSAMAESSYELEIINPKGETVLTKSFRSDRFGGFDGEFALAKDAGLGNYRISINKYSGGSFRVEEYKKPEFEVTVDAPADPIALGEQFTAKVNAKYYFGAPVTDAHVKVKIERSEHTSGWFPYSTWDWLYGNGYWWFSYNYTWFPHWRSWGCERPFFWWWPRSYNPPELIAESEHEIGADGTLQIPIDTSLAKELHGDSDHSYKISVEVVDKSRRTIYGTGNVLVARAPFKVYAWVDRGYYQAGDTIKANFKSQRIDGKAVAGSGELKLYSISYTPGSEKPIEKEVGKWIINTDSEGSAAHQLKAADDGQYRLSYTVKDSAGHSVEGGYLFTVYGDAFNSESFIFNDLELISEKREYAPGDRAKLLINTNQSDSTVLLFLRPVNSTYEVPLLLNLKGKSTTHAIEITKGDMPNFFVEALTIAKGRVFSEMREVYVPPEKRVLNVEVSGLKEEYLPDEEVELMLKLTDQLGKPFVGSTVISVYDKALEYISGGSNVPEIKEFFWKWRKNHGIQLETNVNRYEQAVYRPNDKAMRLIGAFGDTIADDFESDEDEGRRDRSPLKRKLMAPAGASGMERFSSDMALNDMAFAGKSVAMEAAAPAPQAGAAMASEEGPPLVEPQVRKEFADTAFWAASITTTADGTAKVKFKAPQNLTAWKVRTWAMGNGTRVGEGSASFTTSKNLVLRLQAPRFFVERDEVILSANIHNYLSSAKSIKAKIELPGEFLEILDGAERTIEIASDSEARVDWRVKVLREGQAIVRMSALSDEESDAMEMRFPVYVHGMLKTDSFSGALSPEDTNGTLSFLVPAERRPDQSRLELRYSPTLAGAMVDALPYLADYPYGCTEQTLSRFLPSIITQKILKDMKLNLAAIEEKRANLNAQEIGNDTERAKQWKRFDRNPVFNEAELGAMVKAGIERLLAMQLSDGGWGWFSGWNEVSTAHTTAHVVHGLQIAAALGLDFDRSAISRGLDWLKHYQAGEIQKLKNAPTRTHPYKSEADNLDAFVSMVLSDGDSTNAEMVDFLFRDKNKLAVYGKALLGMSLHAAKDNARLREVMENISQYIVEDDENQTAYLNLGNEGYWWYWYGSEYEAHAYYLKLLARVEPESRVASRLVKYLLNNRKNGTYWNSTRDTALIVEAFADYLKATKELSPDMTLEILLDGSKVKEVKINNDNLFVYDNKLVLAGSELTSGNHTLEIRRKGKGPLYYNAYLTNFTLEDNIKKAGLEIKVERRLYRLIDADEKGISRGSHGQVVEEMRDKYKREEILPNAILKSGDLIEVELIIESKNDYEYIIFEDMKAAGFEAVEVRSGYNSNELGAYVEYRDERVAFFSRTLPRGKRSVSYRLKAEIPGKFSALPARAYAMYAPELKANSDENKVAVAD